MATFAQIVNNQALNVIIGDTAQDALAVHFVEGYDGGHPGVAWTAVPDGTTSGATTTDNGATFINPPPLPTIPFPLSKTAFNLVAASALGSGTTGYARFQDIMDACEASKGEVKFCFTQYESADILAKDQVAAFTSIMVAASIMTANERTAILAAWPSA